MSTRDEILDAITLLVLNESCMEAFHDQARPSARALVEKRIGPLLPDDKGVPPTAIQAGWLDEVNDDVYAMDPIPENHADDVANPDMVPLYRFRPSAVPESDETE
jgi:hypothetical protein